MTDDDRDSADDPWLTLVEIAEELKVNPATVRQWISKGLLKATRPGLRKLLVRRSELDRMLRAREASTGAAGPRVSPPLRPVFSRPLLGQVARARAGMDPAVIQDAIRSMQEAEAEFDGAVSASNDAPPDRGFAGRIRAVADACLRRAEALSQAERIPGFRWTPVPHPESPIRSHELRPGGNRPGAELKWRMYDMAVERLTIAVQGNLPSLVATEFREIGWVLNEIADELDQGAGVAGESRS